MRQSFPHNAVTPTKHKEPKMNAALTVQAVRKAFNGINGIDPCGETYPKLIALLDRSDDDTIKALAAANIKFVSKLALNRCVTRNLI